MAATGTPSSFTLSPSSLSLTPAPHLGIGLMLFGRRLSLLHRAGYTVLTYKRLPLCAVPQTSPHARVHPCAYPSPAERMPTPSCRTEPLSSALDAVSHDMLPNRHCDP